MDIRGMATKIKDKYIKINTENVFLIIALVIGILMACINPPFQECDGWDHFLRAMDVSYGNVLLPIKNLTHESDVITVPDNILSTEYRIIEADNGEGRDYINYLKSIKFSEDTTYMTYGQGTMSLFYYPQALGLFLGRCFNLSIYGCVVLSRIINLMAFLGLTYMAIKITPILKNVFVVIALFPMTIYQAASSSPDSMLNGLCFLFVAMCLYYAYGDKEQLTWKEALKLGGLLAVIFLSKYIYVCLGLLVFLIPSKRFGTKKEYFKSFAIALIPLIVMAGLGYVSASSAVSSGQASSATGMTQMEYLSQNPIMILKVLLYACSVKFSDYMIWLNTLGSLNYSLGPLIYIVPMYAMYVSGSDVNEYCSRIQVKDRVLALVSFAVICAGIIMGIYIGDGRINEVGNVAVQGVQGRYFIAALPTLFIAIVPSKAKNEDNRYTYKVLGVMAVLLIMAVSILKIHCA